jgi:hypothetical protein
MTPAVVLLSFQALWLVPTRARAAEADSVSCDQVLATECDAARRQGLFACGNCVGVNSQKLKDAGCNDTYAGQFCNNQTCVIDVCSEARAEGPFQCAKCLGQHDPQLDQCSLQQQMEYCQFEPAQGCPPAPDDLTNRTINWFGCHNVQIVSMSINGAQGNDATSPISQPVDIVVEWTDRISGACSCPTCWWQHLGFIYLWKDDDQLHEALVQDCFKTYEGENLPAGGINHVQFTPTVPGIYYFETGIDQQMSCADSDDKGKKSTNFSMWQPPTAPPLARVTVHG